MPHGEVSSANIIINFDRGLSSIGKIVHPVLQLLQRLLNVRARTSYHIPVI
jgi:hypothetical protein